MNKKIQKLEAQISEGMEQQNIGLLTQALSSSAQLLFNQQEGIKILEEELDLLKQDKVETQTLRLELEKATAKNEELQAELNRLQGSIRALLG